MSYPTDEPVRARILANLVAVLQAAMPPATTYKFEHVALWGGNVLTFPALPGAAVIPIVETSNDNRMALQEHEMDVAIQVALADAEWQSKIERLASDVRVAILADYSRGGNAVNTRILTTEIFDATDTVNPIAAAQVNLRILYRTLYTDPSEAH